eukprot:4965308-Pleurochrysis_carterae.AAC.1
MRRWVFCMNAWVFHIHQCVSHMNQRENHALLCSSENFRACPYASWSPDSTMDLLDELVGLSYEPVGKLRSSIYPAIAEHE